MKKEIIRLQDPVVVRKVPMTAQGCDLLRLVKDYQISQFKEQMQKDIDIQWPTVIHLMIQDYCRLKGLELK